MDPQHLVDDLRAALVAVSDTEVAAGQKKYMREQFEYLGVKTPARRRASKSIIKYLITASRAELIAVVELLWAQPEREFQYVAADSIRAHISAPTNTLTSADVEWLGTLAMTKSWWDTVDSLDLSVGAICTPAHMRTWARHNNMWLRRIAIDHQLLRKEATDTELLADVICANLGSTEFFINKAIGWALRDYAKTDPEWVRAFVAEHELSPLSRREALKHL